MFIRNENFLIKFNLLGPVCQDTGSPDTVIHLMANRANFYPSSPLFERSAQFLRNRQLSSSPGVTHLRAWNICLKGQITPRDHFRSRCPQVLYETASRLSFAKRGAGSSVRALKRKLNETVALAKMLAVPFHGRTAPSSVFCGSASLDYANVQWSSVVVAATSLPVFKKLM